MKVKLRIAVIAASVAATAPLSMAHEGAMGVVKERMELMKQIGDATKALSDMMRGKSPYDAEQVRALAATLAAHGGARMTALFPQGSSDAPSEALPAIWADWERFSELAGRLSDYAAALAAAADNRGAPGAGHMTGGAGMSGGMDSMMAGGMMGGSDSLPPAEHLSGMPADMVFLHVTETCAACHEDFRKKTQ